MNRDLSNKIFLEPSREDVDVFLTSEFCKINESFPYLKEKCGDQWPTDEAYLVLVEKSLGYFMLLKTALRHINPPALRGRAPDQRLRDILESFSADPLRPLDALYLCILRKNVPQNPAQVDEWKTIIRLICVHFTGTLPIGLNVLGPTKYSSTCFESAAKSWENS